MKMIMNSSPEKSIRSTFSSFLKSISSYNSNILLVALISLLLVILFVLLLHFYARHFWSAADEARRRRRRRRRRRVVTRRIPSSSARGFLENTTITSTITTNTATVSPDDGAGTKGLDSWVISSIPLFVYEDDEEGSENDGSLECVICLSMLELGDVGRKLGQCGHGFHVECIDMWLSSHSTCPLCRSPVLATRADNLKPTINNNNNHGDDDANNGVEDVSLQVFSGEEDDDGSRPETEFDDQNAGDPRSSSSSSSSSVGCSLKRMLSRSRSERKVFPSSSICSPEFNV